MNRPESDALPSAEASVRPREGWHCTHLYYRFDRSALTKISDEAVAEGRRQMAAALDPSGPDSPTRMQTSITSGHRADFGLLLLDPDPLRIDSVHQRLRAGPLGPALEAAASFVSLTEVSEYLPTAQQYAEKLEAAGESKESAGYQAKVNADAERLPRMRSQRLTPQVPDGPATCFYPMNKKRTPGENWFTLPFAERSRLMAEHARSGMQFAGRVQQLVTAGVGLDDWEWGVTLWAQRPDLLKNIVYQMRFDEASARYAQFGAFYVGYVATAERILDHCRVGRVES